MPPSRREHVEGIQRLRDIGARHAEIAGLPLTRSTSRRRSAPAAWRPALDRPWSRPGGGAAARAERPRRLDRNQRERRAQCCKLCRLCDKRLKSVRHAHGIQHLAPMLYGAKLVRYGHAAQVLTSDR